ncbi:MAG TPA: L,D-transpeptidase family protein [Thermoanaerobaculia bacterium]
MIVILLAALGGYMLYRPRFAGDDVATDASPRKRLEPYFRKAGVAYPPRQIAFLIFKDERRVTLWAKSGDDWRFVRHYEIQAASGHAGPKLREGDKQVPEGVYRIEHLNPNSAYHLSMKVSYPNAFDRRMAHRDRRTKLGGDIFIHGKAVSIGCVAVGDRAIEELFALVKETGVSKVKVIIAPNDFRAGRPILHRDVPPWTSELYRDIANALSEFPLRKEGMPNARVAFR